MNKTKIIELLLDNAAFDSVENKLYHPSFRKGWRKMTTSDISWQAVKREHGCVGTKRLQEITANRITLKSI
jgi:hypothetical protein